MHIRAPFFTYDSDIEAGLFTLRQYARLWEDIPLEFIIPFTSSDIPGRYRKELPPHLKLTFTQTDTSLGAGFPSWIDKILLDTTDPWFFWCSSDRYPIALASNSALLRLFRELPLLTDNIDAVRIARWKDTRGEEQFQHKKFAGLPFSERPLKAHGLWHPQFMSRRHLAWIAQVAADTHPIGMQDFNKSLVEGIQNTGFMGLHPRRPLIKLEEPTYRGKSTLNLRYRLHLEGRTKCKLDKVSPLWVSFSSPAAQNRNEFWFKPALNSLAPNNTSDCDKHFRRLVSRTLPNVPRVIVTFGGCGSKFIVKQLYPGADVPSLNAAHSHWRIPPVKIQKGQKILYVFGDPRNAIISFFQRRTSLTRLHGFVDRSPQRQANAKASHQKGWVKKALYNLETDSGPLNENWDLGAFLNHGLDLFRLEEHFDNWAFSLLPYQVVFCRYESILQHWEQLCEIMAVPPLPLPSLQKRRADWKALPPGQQAQINEIYGGLARRLESYPGLFVANGQGQLLDTSGNPLFLESLSAQSNHQ